MDPRGVEYVAEAFEDYSAIVDDTTTTSIDDDTFLGAHMSTLYVGRVDDQLSDPPNERVVFLPHLKALYATAAPARPASYVQQQFVENPPDTYAINYPALTGVKTDQHPNAIGCYHYLTSGYTAAAAVSGTLPGGYNLLLDSLLTATTPLESAPMQDLYDMIPRLKSGGRLAVVPVFFKTHAIATQYLGASAYGEAFVAFIYKRPVSPLVTAPSFGEFFGFSPSEYTCELSQMVTTQKRTSTNSLTPGAYPEGSSEMGIVLGNVLPEIYYPFLYAGASDAAIRFDGENSRFSISQFHTPTKVGNGPFQNPSDPAAANPSQNIMTIVEGKAYVSRIADKWSDIGRVQVYRDIDAQSTPHPVISAQAGVALAGVSIPHSTGLPVEQESVLRITANNAPLFDGSILAKMGYTFEQLMPLLGAPQNQFNRGNYNRYLGLSSRINARLKYLNMVKPFTTNAYISSAEQIGFAQTHTAVYDGQLATKYVWTPVPAENLGSAMGAASTNATSDELIAVNLPKKLAYPYLVVYSDIVANPSYIGGSSGHTKLQAIAYLTRNYTEGDFFYNSATSWTHTVDLPHVLSSIRTSIRLPDGTEAPIDENSSVIYKIVKPQAMPVAPTPAELKAMERGV
jgi:hypothetical protein